MKCPKCGSDEPSDFKFCGSCGAPLKDSAEIKAAITEVNKTATESKTEDKSKFMPDKGAVSIGEETVVEAVATPVVTATVDKKAAKIAESEAKKQAKIEAKQNAKEQKVLEKKEKEQNMIDACPKCYKPVSANSFFWLILINAIPVVGLIFSFFASLISPNRNIKKFEKASCIWLLILTLLVGAVVLFGVFYFGDDNIFEIIYDLGDALGF